MPGHSDKEAEPGGFKGFIGRRFPRREIMLRTGGRVSYFRFSTRLQVSLFSVFFAFFAWSGYTSVSYVLQQRVVDAKDDQIAYARLAYQGLLAQVTDYQKRFSELSSELQENHGLMLSLVEKNASLQRSLRLVENRLTMTKEEQRAVTEARERLQVSLGKIQRELDDLANRNFSLKGNLESVEGELQTALIDRNQALFNGVQLNRLNRDLENRLLDLQQTELDTVERLSESTVDQIENLERVIRTTGLDVANLVTAQPARPDLPQGQGGPFVSATTLKSDDLPGNVLRAGLQSLDAQLRHSEALSSVVGKLPLAAPMKSFYITSNFGKRRDPVNRKWAMHYGLDMGGPPQAPVYATAPGTVTFAGWKGYYGRLVEIDHGAGLKSRYGHLKKIFVKKGQKLNFYDRIGLLGSSGRSTGPHLHYEVVFNRKVVNPAKFIEAGRRVFQK